MKLHAPVPHRGSVGEVNVNLTMENEKSGSRHTEDQNLVPYIESMMETIIGLVISDEEDSSLCASRDPLESRPVSPVLDALGVRVLYTYMCTYIYTHIYV
jgi:hypothetical protein